MFDGIFTILYDIIWALSINTVTLINNVFGSFNDGDTLYDLQFNLSLFSESPIISTNLFDIILLFFTIFYSMFFIILLYKVTKKIIKKVFGVIRL